MTPEAKEDHGVIDGGIYEYQDELFIVEKIYGAMRHKKDGKGLEPVTLVKIRCIEPMPRHVDLDVFRERYKLYDPEAP